MTRYNPEVHHRRSIRLPGYDYSRAGLYFVTICTHQRRCLFGDVVGGTMVPGAAGELAETFWCDLPNRFSSVGLDAFVIMPNHIHGIITIVGAQFIAPFSGTPTSRATRQDRRAEGPDATNRGAMNQGAMSRDAMNQGAMNRAPTTVGQIVRTFKATTTREIRRIGIAEFAWQRNYYERVIRDAEELDRIREYIVTNPARWPEDSENPAHRR